jgi:(R,R)-butanediol dehydrogenase/meso-butanediol dehydrogenase/diacetyl reductase
MRAAVFKSVGKPLTIERVPDPSPAIGEVLIRISRCGICGSDLHITDNPEFAPTSGAILGHEYAGELVAIGPGVDCMRTGERVAVLPARGCYSCARCLAGDPVWCPDMQITGGGFAEYCVVAQEQCVRLPSTVGLADGALVEPLAVGLHGVLTSAMRTGDRILIIGAGPIGLAVAFWARRLGAKRIAVTASSARRAELAQILGAHAFIDAGEDLSDRTSRCLSGAPDIVFECVGQPGLINLAINVVRPRGTVVVLGLCMVPDEITPLVALIKEVRVQAAMMYNIREFEAAADILDSSIPVVRAMVTDTVSLTAMPEAFEALRHRTTQCKVLVAPFH